MTSSQSMPTIQGVTHHTVAVNGTELHFVSAGTIGSPVLLVHGFPESWWAFRKLIPLLAESHRVFAVDLRGSETQPRPTTITTARSLLRISISSSANSEVARFTSQFRTLPETACSDSRSPIRPMC